MKRFIIILTISTLVAFLSCKKESTAPSGYDQEILDMINTHRAGIGKPPLQMDEFIWQLAHEHCSNMADGDIPFGHDGYTERSDKIRAQYGLGATAENIATGQGSAAEVVNSWLASVGHKSNIEGDYNLTGLSAVKSKNGKWYYTQIFYKKN